MCRLRFVSERADSSETLMSVSIPERAGAIREFYKLIYPRNVTELSYRWSDPKHADIVLSLQTLKGHTLEEDKKTGEPCTTASVAIEPKPDSNA